MGAQQDSIIPLVEHAVHLRYSDIPASVIAHTLDLLLDTVGCILGGSGAPEIAGVKRTLDLWGGNRQAKVLAFDEWTAAPTAAFLNSVMAHARDYDDTHDRAVNHGCVTLVPALFALTQALSTAAVRAEQEMKPLPVSGKDLLAALAVGLDIANRLGMAFIPYLHVGWLPTTLWGPIACAAACGRLLGLDSVKMHHALGMAYAQIHGNRQALVDGAMAKRIQPAFSAAAGINAALFARNGLTAAAHIVDGDFGIAALYTGGRVDREALVSGLGTRFETENVGIKPYPSCRCTHPVIDAALRLKGEQGIQARRIASGTILLPPQSMGQIGNPLKLRDNPAVDAQFSAQFTAALAFVRGRPRIRDFQAENVRAAGEVLELASRFRTVEFEQQSSTLTPVELRVRLTDGDERGIRIEHPKGSAENPLSREELLEKFDDCLGNSRKSYPQQERSRIVERIYALSSLDTAAELVRDL